MLAVYHDILGPIAKDLAAISLYYVVMALRVATSRDGFSKQAGPYKVWREGKVAWASDESLLDAIKRPGCVIILIERDGVAIQDLPCMEQVTDPQLYNTIVCKTMVVTRLAQYKTMTDLMDRQFHAISS